MSTIARVIAKAAPFGILGLAAVSGSAVADHRGGCIYAAQQSRGYPCFVQLSWCGHDHVVRRKWSEFRNLNFIARIYRCGDEGCSKPDLDRIKLHCARLKRLPPAEPVR